MSTENIWVTIVEDTNRFREIFALIIDGMDGYRCVSQYEDCESAMQNIVEDNPDVILMDIELGDGKVTGIEAVRLIKEKLPETEIVMLTVHEDNDDYIFDSLCAGASGYLTKDVSPDALLDAIRQAYKGGAPMSPAIARRVVTCFQQQPGKESEFSAQETRVLSLAAADLVDKEIADKMNISRDTVRYHFKSIYQKLQVHSKHGAIAKAMRKGLL